MEKLLLNLALLFNTETSDISRIWDSYQAQVSFVNVEFFEESNSITFDANIRLKNGWKAYFPNEQNGGNELKVDLLEQEDEKIFLDFPDPEILYAFGESFVGYNKDYVVSGVLRNVDFSVDSTTLKVNISFCSNLCVPEEFIIPLRNH